MRVYFMTDKGGNRERGEERRRGEKRGEEGRREFSPLELAYLLFFFFLFLLLFFLFLFLSHTLTSSFSHTYAFSPFFSPFSFQLYRWVNDNFLLPSLLSSMPSTLTFESLDAGCPVTISIEGEVSAKRDR